MEGKIRSSSGLAFLVVLPWIVAAASLALAAVGWMRAERAPVVAPVSDRVDGGTELKKLRLALATADAENNALRQELDRIVVRGKQGAAGPATPAAGPTPVATPRPEALKELGSRLQQSIALAAAGDQGAARDAAMAMMEVLKSGPQAFSILRDTFAATSDPKGRLLMLPTLIFSGGKEARDLLIEQVQTETDPDLHRALINQTANFATPDVAPALQDTFLKTVRSDSDANTRIAAIRGLRYAHTPQADEALLSAASDASPDVRLAAIENLASRPGLRDELRALIDAESSSEVREVAECRLLLAERAH